MRVGEGRRADGRVEGRKEAPGCGRVRGRGRAEGPLSLSPLQRFSPGRRAGLKLLEDLVLPQSEERTGETWESSGCLCAELCAPPPQHCPRGRRQAAPLVFPRQLEKSLRYISCESKAIQAVPPGPLGANPRPGRPSGLDRRQEAGALQATPDL